MLSEDTIQPLSTLSTGPIELRQPSAADGPALTDLIARCPPLDPNSRYCNLLQCAHFGATAVFAWSDWRGPAQLLVGSVTGYLPPQNPSVLFVWQVAVAKEGRGKGLAKSMLVDLLKRPACAGVTFIETTITADNQASWGLFRGLARDLNCACEKSLYFDQQQHFDNQHDSEFLCRIGPFTNPTVSEQ